MMLLVKLQLSLITVNLNLISRGISLLFGHSKLSNMFQICQLLGLKRCGKMLNHLVKQSVELTECLEYSNSLWMEVGFMKTINSTL
mgnify:CR=1 FL=1